MDMEKQEGTRYFKWVEPTLIIKKSNDDITSYILYNRISNYKIKNDSFKIVLIESPKYKSNYSDYINEYRDDYVKYIENLHPESYKNDAGFSAMVDAIRSKNGDLILIYKNFVLMGAVSYTINDKKKTIIIDRIGTIEKRCGYGKSMMMEIFSIASILHYSVTATSNGGTSDKFYKSLNMTRIIDKPLGIYTLEAKDIGR
jgi:hypothetical protein